MHHGCVKNKDCAAYHFPMDGIVNIVNDTLKTQLQPT